MKMTPHTSYKIIIEDESRLENVMQASASRTKWILLMASSAILLMAIGALLCFLTPLRNLLPGYLKASERAATMEQHLRLDSLRNAYDVNKAYIENIYNVLDPASPTEIPRDTHDAEIDPDSLLAATPEELRFAAMMRERDKYNISVIAPLAAESMTFLAVNDASVITEKSKSSEKAEIVLPRGATVAAIAEGTVIAISQSIKDGGGASVIIQHPKGFLSRCSRLGSVNVEAGERVSAGQVIAMSSAGNGIRGEFVNLEMWHNGTPVVPYEYIGVNKPTPSRVVDID